MEFLKDVPQGAVDVSTEGLNGVLTQLRTNPRDPRSPFDKSRVQQFQDDPRAVLTHILQLRPAQQGVLDQTSDDELRESLRPVFTALSQGKQVRVLDFVQTDSPEATGPAKTSQQQAPNQIVITIGKGRCKITITIDL